MEANDIFDGITKDSVLLRRDLREAHLVGAEGEPFTFNGKELRYYRINADVNGEKENYLVLSDGYARPDHLELDRDIVAASQYAVRKISSPDMVSFIVKNE